MWSDGISVRDIKFHLHQRLAPERAEELIKLWESFDPTHQNKYSFLEFSEKFMTKEELEQCDDCISTLQTEMAQQQQIIDILKRIDQGVVRIDQERLVRIEQGVQRLIRGQEFVSCCCCLI
jgi:hypothetical protein